MKNIVATILTAFAIFFLGIAGQANAQEKGGHLVLSKLNVKGSSKLKADRPYVANVEMQTIDGLTVGIREMCFFWNKEGPFCFKNFELVKGSDRRTRPTISLSTGNPGKYTLWSFMIYDFDEKRYRTNMVKKAIRVR